MFSQLNFSVFSVEPLGWHLPQMGLQYCNLWFRPLCWLLLHLQAEQIVTKLMMNMLAVDKQLAEEQNRQAMVSENTQNCSIWCICILHEFEMMQHCWNDFAEYSELLSVSSFIFKVLHERLAQRQALAQLRVVVNQQVGREIMFSFWHCYSLWKWISTERRNEHFVLFYRKVQPRPLISHFGWGSL